MKGHGLTRAAAVRTSVSAGRGLGLKIPFLFLPAATEPLKRLHLRGDNGCDSCQLSSQSCCHCAECVTALQDAPKGWRRTDRPRFTAAETGGPGAGLTRPASHGQGLAGAHWTRLSPRSTAPGSLGHEGAATPAARGSRGQQVHECRGAPVSERGA